MLDDISLQWIDSLSSSRITRSWWSSILRLLLNSNSSSLCSSSDYYWASSNSSIGILNVNVEPFPWIELTPISPPSCYIIILDIVRPRPMPPRLTNFDFVTHPKYLNNLPRSAWEIPMPVSEISDLSIPSSKSTDSLMWPLNVNFEALPRRL